MKLPISSVLSLVVLIFFSIGVIFYYRIKKNERQYLRFSSLLSSPLLPIILFFGYAWYWVLLYPVVFIILLGFSKKFFDLNYINKDVRFLTIKEFLSCFKKSDNKHSANKTMDRNPP